MKLAFVDMSAPRPYSLESLSNEGIGGSESSLVRVAEALNGMVLQHNRTQPAGRYLPLETPVTATHVVAFREPAVALEAIRRFPEARVVLWLQDLCGEDSNRGKRILAAAPELARAGVRILGVSRFHRDQIRACLQSGGYGNSIPVGYVYNPVDVEPTEIRPFDRDQLIFFSSPHKGLSYTITVFKYLKRRIPSLRLIVGNPGYMPDLDLSVPGVTVLGALPQRSILQHASESLCTLMPNYIFAETFGCVLAESNAVGTPVLAHPIGAAAEVLGGNEQIVDTPRERWWIDRLYQRSQWLSRAAERAAILSGSFDCYLERIMKWREGGRPRVGLRPEFSMPSVVGKWRQILTEE